MKREYQSTCCCSGQDVWDLLENKKGPRVSVWIDSDDEQEAEDLAKRLEEFMLAFDA